MAKEWWEADAQAEPAFWEADALDKAPARRAVPEMTAGSVARDALSGVLQIGPTALKGVGDLAQLATGGAVGKGLSDTMESGMDAIRKTWGSERAQAQRENFNRDMQDDSVSLKDALFNNKGALADQVLPTVGSMFVPAGAAVGAGRLAQAGNAAKLAGALDPAMMAARVSAAQKAASIGAAAAQNAASVYTDLREGGAEQADAYTGAAVSVPFSLAAGKLAGGGAEAAIANRIAAPTIRQAVQTGAGAVARGAAREGGQEIGEEAGQIVGGVAGGGEAPTAGQVGKRLAVAGTLGAVMGGGVDIASQAGQPNAAQRIAEIDAADSVDAAIEAASRAVAAPVSLPAEMTGDLDTILKRATDGEPGDLGGVAAGDGAATGVEPGGSVADPGRAPDGAGGPGVLPAAAEPVAGGETDLAARSDGGRDAAVDLTKADPGELLLTAQNPTAPNQQAAAAELKRRETEAAYRQREQQQDAERGAIVEEARDQQAAQATAASVSAEVEAPNAMQLAMQRARAKAAPASTPEPAPKPAAVAGEPASVWMGRRGDGYLSGNDAGIALPTRRRAFPDLDWRVEQMASGRYRLAGYPRKAGTPLALGYDTAPTGRLLAGPDGGTRPETRADVINQNQAQQEAQAAAARRRESLGLPELPTVPTSRPRDPRLIPLSKRNVQNTSAAPAQQAPAAQAPSAQPAAAPAGASRAQPAAGATSEAAPGLVKNPLLVPKSQRPATPVQAESAARDPRLTPVSKRKAEPPAAKEDDGQEPLFSRAPATETPEFRRWFGDSKVVDAKGKPRVVYHGTTSDFDAFSKTKATDKDGRRLGMGWGRGKFYFAESGEAASSAASFASATGRGSAQNVMPVYLSITKPISAADYMARVDSQMASGKDRDAAIAATDRALRKDGYDGIVDEESGGMAVFEPQQIKSATGNRGTFDPTNPDIRMSRGRGASSRLATVQATADTIRKAWTNGPDVIVVQNMQDERLPQRIREADEQQKSQGATGEPRGVFYRGKVYLVADQLGSPRDIAEVLFHEALGHYGLRGVFGDALKPILREVSVMRRADVRAKAEEYGLDMDSERDRLLAAEEVLAEMAQTRPEIGIVKRAIAAIRTWLRKNVPGLDTLRMTNDEIVRNYLMPARGWVERGREAEATEGAPAFSKAPATDSEAFKRWFGDSKVVDAEGKPLVVYHGTGGDFDSFDASAPSSHIPLPGFYFSPDPDVASGFAESAAKIRENRAGRPFAPIGANVVPVYVSVQNPSEIDASNEANDGRMPSEKAIRAKIEAAKSAGHDGVVIRGWSDGSGPVQYVAFRPEQIKSATGNQGTFDPTNPDIRFSRGTTPSVANSKDVAGNTSGRPAGDSTEGDTLELFHGSPESGLSAVDDRARSIFGGVFASTSAESARSHGENVYKTGLPRASILTQHDLDHELPNDRVEAALRKEMFWLDDADYDDAYRAVIEDQADRLDSDDLIRIFRQEDAGESSWEAQRIRGQVARRLGYKAVEMSDEHGTSYLVLPGVKVTPANDSPAPNSDGAPMFSRGSAARGSWNAPGPSQFDDLVYKMQDKQIDTKRVVEAVREAGKTLADSADVYLQEELFHGRAAKRTEDFVSRELKPLLLDMQARGITQDALGQFLHARHAKEANDLIADRNPDLPDGGSGMTTAEAKKYLAQIPAAERTRLEAVARKVDAIIAGTRGLYVAYGLESADTVQGWASMFKHYVPLMREDHDGGMGIGQGFSIKGKETKGRVGSKSAKVIDILANIAIQREKAIVRGEKNRVARALYGLAVANPNPEFWATIRPGISNEKAIEVLASMGIDFRGLPWDWNLRGGLVAGAKDQARRDMLQSAGIDPDLVGNMLAAPTIQALDKATGKVVSRPNPMYAARDNALTMKIDGKPHVVLFNEDDPRAMRMATALKNLDATQLEGMLGVSAKITRYFAAINTQYNPVFGAVNFIRDVQGAILNLTSTELANHKAEIAKNTLSALRGVYIDVRDARAGKPTGSAWAQLWEEFQSIGGQTGYRDLYRTSADRAKAIEYELNPSAWMDSRFGKLFSAGGRLKVPLAIAQKRAEGVFGWLSDYNLAMENSVRLASYKAGLDAGMTKERAASLAKNLTVNFNRKGQVTQQAGALYAFFNAAVQGTARMGQTLFTMEGGDASTIRLSKTGKKIVAGGILLGSMQALLLAAAGFDDEEPPDFVRERNIVIPISGGKYVAIPMPLGLHILPNLGRIPTEFVLGGFKKPQQHLAKMFGLVVDAFSPVGGGSGSLVQAISPTAIDPIVALAENRDFTGKPIAKQGFDKTTPGHKLAKDTASTPAKWLSEAINYLSGGTDHVAGVFSPTPDQIDYLWGQVTGGVGREISKAEQSVSATAKGEDLPPHKIPLLGRFYGDTNSRSAQSNRFYARLHRVAELEAEIKGLSKEGKGAELREFIQENPEARLMTAAARVEKEVRKLRTLKRDLMARDAPDDQIKAVEDRMAVVIERFNAAAERLKAQQSGTPPAK